MTSIRDSSVEDTTEYIQGTCERPRQTSRFQHGHGSKTWEQYKWMHYRRRMANIPWRNAQLVPHKTSYQKIKHQVPQDDYMEFGAVYCLPGAEKKLEQQSKSVTAHQAD